MTTEIENLGRLAAKSELEAAKSNLLPFERAYLLNQAQRYRDQQYEAFAREECEPYPLANVLSENWTLVSRLGLVVLWVVGILIVLAIVF